jgi:hypothetical protein
VSRRRRSGLALGVAGAIAVSTALVSGSATAATVPAAAVAAPSSVGTVAVHPCHLVDAPVWCGSVRVPLDRSDPSAGTIAVGFGWVPASGPVTDPGTIVAMEGGPATRPPGRPSTTWT